MENKETKQSKIKEENFKIEEIISATSGRMVTNVDFFTNRDKITQSLKNSSDYKYDDKKSLAENIYSAFPQYKLREVTEKFGTWMEKEGSNWEKERSTESYTALIHNDIRARFMAKSSGIPQNLTIKTKEYDKEDKSKNVDIKKEIPESDKSSRPIGMTLSGILTEIGIHNR